MSRYYYARHATRISAILILFIGARAIVGLKRARCRSPECEIDGKGKQIAVVLHPSCRVLYFASARCVYDAG